MTIYKRIPLSSQEKEAQNNEYTLISTHIEWPWLVEYLFHYKNWTVLTRYHRFSSNRKLCISGFLLIPIRHKVLSVIRQCLAVPFGLWLMHYDSFLPPLDRLWSQMDQLLQFNLSYLIELASRFVSLETLLGLFVLVFAYYFLNQIFRISVFVVITLIAISLPSGLFSSQPNAIANVSQQPEIAQTTQISDHQWMKQDQ